METDFLIIGSGIAGLTLALRLSDLGHVTVVTKKGRSETATALAQGGIAAVLSHHDAFFLHEYDTLKAGDGLCHESMVNLCVRSGPDRIRELEALGVEFTRRPDGTYDLGKEGSHSRRRVVHAGDFTGSVIQQILVRQVVERKNITILENHIAVDVLTQGKIRSIQGGDPGINGKVEPQRCVGAYVLDVSAGVVETFVAPVTILATGGAGKVYLYTSNPDVATGDGIAIAYRAGARIANMEFVQFHPTCLYHPMAKNFLISEALRGEGAILLDPDHRPFMHEYAPEEKELATRDLVARAIDSVLKKSGKECVYLDISHRDPAFIKRRFPNIYEACKRYGFDITKEPIPVVPAAHYMCGGVVTDSYGQTDIIGLFAVGETACTGLHGANRLASNSLLEGLVMAARAACHIQDNLEELKSAPVPRVPDWNPGGAVDLDEAVLVSHNWDVIRRLMWDYVGIVRSNKRLALAKKRLSPILEEINRHYWDYTVTRDFLELRNLAQVAELVVRAASARQESRGGHFNMDYPEKDDWNWRRDTILSRDDPSAST